MAFSAQLTVPTAGTAVNFADQLIVGPATIKALPANTGVMYIGGPSVTSANGYPLSAGQTLTMDHLGNMTELWVNATVNGEGVAFLAIGL